MATLDDLVVDLFERPDTEGRSLALVVRKGGEVIAERYGTKPASVFEADETPIDADSTLVSWSMAKSMTHAAVGIMVTDGLVDVDAPAAVPEWVGTPKEEITLLDLLEMRSGLHFLEDYVDDQTSNCIEMLFGDSGPSHAAYAANQPLEHEPGAFWNYSSGTTNIVCRIIGDIVNGSTGGTSAEREASMRRFLSERLFDPVGMTSAEPKFDDAGTFVGSSFVYATARDFARPTPGSTTAATGGCGPTCPGACRATATGASSRSSCPTGNSFSSTSATPTSRSRRSSATGCGRSSGSCDRRPGPRSVAR
jgi:CubicO group peptidase (beta-lactamase class C family)